MRLARRVKADQRALIGFDRLYVLWEVARNVARLRLPAAEIGTYRGGSAYFIAGALRKHLGEDVEMHVFDTFAGHAVGTLAAVDARPFHPEGHFGDTTVEDVTEYLSAFSRVHIHVGDVVDTMDEVQGLRFSLVHIDVDLRLPTQACLEFFGERVPVGGALVIDDYGAPKCPGVKPAVRKYVQSGAGERFHFWHIAEEQAVLIAVAEPGERPS